ncbi:RNA-directed DNA polymerase from mobile element jockey-like protein [Willisornis vidua]|uniref:RNA-directed DNA polymerase from mobile element jockey-like protein n=1 Tax=Willisornis vidua TaxID=1566151 RepID=A0ABQ9D3F1_9PASS|nr:RNA-directed DNA polymerase from mobile element jockey-like protein [Willisornis vidua]
MVPEVPKSQDYIPSGSEEQRVITNLNLTLDAVSNLARPKKDQEAGEGSRKYVLRGVTEVVEWVIPETISKHVEDKKVIRKSQHGFTKEKTCLTDLIAFYHGTSGWIDEGRAVDVVFLEFNKAFYTVSHHMLTGNFRKCVLEEQ